jgi:magnesium transporter
MVRTKKGGDVVDKFLNGTNWKWGNFSMLPIFLKRLGFDPAVSSAPFVATLVDVTGLIIYFSFAYLFLQGLLL